MTAREAGIEDLIYIDPYTMDNDDYVEELREVENAEKWAKQQLRKEARDH